MVIENYEDFKRALREDRKAREFVGGSKNEYRTALDELLCENREKYLSFAKKLQKEFESQKAAGQIFDSGVIWL